MLAGTGLDSLCEIAGNTAEMKSKVTSLFTTEFNHNQLAARTKLLRERFSDEVNGEKLIHEIFGV